MALYDRLEQLEAENDILKSEILTLSNRIEGSVSINGNFSGSNLKQTKPRKNKERKEGEDAQKDQSSFQVPVDPVKSIAAKITAADYESKSLHEKNRMASSFDEDSALETISWAILNSGRVPQIRYEIGF